MPRTILIVDDNIINRELLKKTLSTDYEIWEAENGKEALEIMRHKHKLLSAVLLDIMMPIMDGYEVLRQRQTSLALSQIPVIMITGSEDEESRVAALSLGANDFVMKPYNPEIIKHCLRNNIALRETASIINAIQRDKLTGLYNRETFFERVSEAVRAKEPGFYILASFDVDNFKLINDQYGAVEGDRILQEIGHVVKEDMAAIGGVAGRISADNFAALIPFSHKELSITRTTQQNRMAFSENQAIVFSVGRYIVSDPSLPASALYDRAYIAKQSVKGRYDEHIAYFDETMLEKLVRDQQIIADMDTAIAERHFEVWFQPQYNHSSGALIGAEALVRWRHPERGLIPPGEFIPVFEQNGFVYELDKYVWEESCRYLRKWINEGRDPAPVSVNISRYDIFRSDLIKTILGLVRKYDIPVDMLRLEITESAFARSTKQIVKVIQRLVDYGFTIEIDDFGSGYSSLNTLKSVPAQVVKLDMRFLEDDDDSLRGGNILESIVRMTKWLGMSVIAEGVEQQEQADFLLSIGCNYVQGYLYARPMPADEYEKLEKGVTREARFLSMEAVANLDNNSFWNPKSMDTLIFNSYVGGACIFEYFDGNIELLRANEKFARILGDGTMSVEDTLKLDWISCLTPESLAAVRSVLKTSGETGDEMPSEYVFINIPGGPPKTYLRATLRVIATAGRRQLVYCTCENITAQREAEQSQRALAERLQSVLSDLDRGAAAMQELLDNLPCGAALYELDGRSLNSVHINKRYWELVGREPAAPGTSVLSAVHPDDAPAIAHEILLAIREKRDASTDARVLFGYDGSYRPFHIVGRIIPKENGKYSVYASYTPISDEAMTIRDMLPVALSVMMAEQTDFTFVKDKNLKYVCCSRPVARLAGLDNEADIVGKTDHDIFESDLADQFAEADRRLMELNGSMVDTTETIRLKDGRVLYVNTSKYPLHDSKGNVIGMYGLSRDITEARETKTRLEILTNNVPGGIAIYEGSPSELGNIRLSYFSDGFCRLFGYTRAEYESLAESNPLSLVFSDDLSMINAQMRALVLEGKPMDCVYRAKINDGSFKWINIKAVIGEPRGELMTVNAVLFDVTEQQSTLERLRISEEENRLAIEHSKKVICRYNVAERAISMTAGVNPVFEMPDVIRDVPYGPIRDGSISPATANSYIAFFEGIHKGEKHGASVYQRRTKQGWRWLEADFSTIFSDSGEPVSAVISFSDATERLEKETVFKKWQQSLEDRDPDTYTLFRGNISKNLSIDSREGNLLRAELVQDLTTLDDQVEMYAMRYVYSEDRERYLAFMKTDTLLANYYRGKRSDIFEYRENLPDGGARWLRCTVELVEYPNSKEIEGYLMFENINESKQTELLTLEQAKTDPLTGVLNRTTFAAEAGRIIRAFGPEAQHALMMMDIDGFKLVNDFLGHGMGDNTLVDMAKALRSALRRNDLIGRLGGDEFVVFLPNTTGDDSIAKKAAQICELMRRSFNFQLSISGSVGIAVCPRDGADFDALYKKADAALYSVKDSGKNDFAFYHDGMADEHIKPSSRPARDPITEPAEQKRRMLIVDDNSIDHALLEKIFADDFIIEKAVDGNSALVRLRHYGPAIAVVLLDLMMPGIDGFAVLRKMQENAEMRKIPVIIVSGAEDRETSLDVIRYGASDFLTKPVDPELLQIRVQTAISKAENERLRIQSAMLEYQSGEVSRYKTVLERTGVDVIEYDWASGAFSYDESISAHIAGAFDERELWSILLEDNVANEASVHAMRELVTSLAMDKARSEATATVQLRTPQHGLHWFRMNVFKLVHEFGLTKKLLITLYDAGAERVE